MTLPTTTNKGDTKYNITLNVIYARCCINAIILIVFYDNNFRIDYWY